MKPGRLLVIDDEPDIARFIGIVAEGLGYKITVTSDAETFKEFRAVLDSPPATNPRLRRLLTEKAPWDR